MALGGRARGNHRVTVRGSILGRKVGKLTVVGELPSTRYRRWVCRCDCGNEVARYSSQLSPSQKYIACCSGCHAESTRQRSTVHGHAPRNKRNPEYIAWKAMRNRCAAKVGHPDYPYWAGRGIKICERWEDYAAFLADMGPRPSDKHSLDRINVDGHYEPGNCRWATLKEQRANQRRAA